MLRGRFRYFGGGAVFFEILISGVMVFSRYSGRCSDFFQLGKGNVRGKMFVSPV